MQTTEFQGKKSGGKCIWDTGSQVQGAVDYHRTSTRDCERRCHDLCSVAQHTEEPDFGGGQLVGGGGNPGAERNPSREAKGQWDYMKEYFNNAGAVPWQDDQI